MKTFIAPAISGAHTARRAPNRLCFANDVFPLIERKRIPDNASNELADTFEKQTKAFNHPWIRLAAAISTPRMPQARDAPTKTFRPRKLLLAERQPSDSLGCQDGPRAKTPENLSGREPRQVASRTRPVAGQGNQLMRILPYESAAVKVRVQGRLAKSGHFYAIGVANSAMPLLHTSCTAVHRSSRCPNLMSDARSLGEEQAQPRRFGKVCPKSRSRITDTDA